MQSKGAYTGGLESFSQRASNTLNLDLNDWSTPDNNVAKLIINIVCGYVVEP